MKVIHVGPGGAKGLGGIGRYIFYVLADKQAAADGISYATIDSYGHRGGAAMAAVFLLSCIKVLWVCLSARADILHIHMSHYGSCLRKGILLLLGKACGTKVVLHIHGSCFHLFCDGLTGWRRKLLVAVLGRADRIVVIAHVWKDYVLGLGLPPEKVLLIPNGVPDPGLRPRSATTGGEQVLLGLGALGPRKGTPEILQALSDPRLRPLAWRAVIAGNGDVAGYRQAFAEAGLGERTALPGWVGDSQVQALLDQADLLLLPSRQEGLPLAILEGLAAGIPVISTPVGGIPDAVIDGETGLLVPPGDAAALASAILRLMEDGDLRRRLGMAGRQLFEAEFDIRITCARLLSLYHELCPAPARGALGSVGRGS